MTFPLVVAPPPAVGNPPSAKWANQVDNELAFIAGKPSFKASVRSSATAFTASTNMDFTSFIIDNTIGVWSSVNKNLTIPTGADGRYWLNGQTSQGVAIAGAQAVFFVKNGTNILISANSGSSAISGGAQLTGYYSFDAGDVISMRVATAYTTTNAAWDTNFFEIVYLGQG